MADISARYEHFVNTDAALTAAQQQQLAQLLDYGTPVTGDAPAKSLELLVIPRLGTISRGPARPPTSPTTAAWTPCAAARRALRDHARARPAGRQDLDAAMLARAADCLHDRMTETVVDAGFDGQALFQTLAGKPMRTVAVQARGAEALVEANATLGLALSDDEIEYLAKSFSDLGRDPTDVELMMFAQANSEHCRHKIFNAQWVIDGQEQPNTLFGMIRATHKAQPAGTVVAYSDNAAIGRRPGPALPGRRARPAGRGGRGADQARYIRRDTTVHTLMKVETHNHPTAIAVPRRVHRRGRRDPRRRRDRPSPRPA